MTNAYVLMTALPPTKGHLHLIQFASSLATHAHVILCTQPDEPFWEERLLALQKATQSLPNVLLHHIHKTLPQEPEQDPGFWDMWADFLCMFGFQKGDYVVASEYYGNRLAEEVGGIFMPYDIQRQILYTKATDIRKDTESLFEKVLPEFQPYVRKTITIFGAESCGKTTLAGNLSASHNGWFIPEWARPYLETVGEEPSYDKMINIWKGQYALQKQGRLLLDKPYVFQDTDLYSTIGYWLKGSWAINEPPPRIVLDAAETKSDLYLMLKSNIPFEADPLRYGGDKREIDDDFWENLLNDFRLPYKIIESKYRSDRMDECDEHIEGLLNNTLSYKRITKESLGV